MPRAAAVDHEACYRAVQARDHRFDGRFCTAVVTTGIYCRPSCPARTPKRTSVRFYACAAAAEEAGFRACKRCRPEAAPGDPGWDRRADLVGRAVRLIADGATAAGGVAALARRLDVSERHLRRLFVDELGTGPLQVAASRRLALARLLLGQTDLPVTQVAFAAGFTSIRRFNDAVARAYGAPPSRLREPRPSAGAATGMVGHDTTHVVLRLRLPARPPFAGPAVLAFLAGHLTPGVEEVVGGTYRRTVGGGVLAASPDATGLSVELRLDDVRRVGSLVGAARRLFDLDCDPGAVADVLGADPLLAPALAATPGVRLPGAVNGFESAVRTVLGQQVSVAGATTLAARLVHVRRAARRGRRRPDLPLPATGGPGRRRPLEARPHRRPGGHRPGAGRGGGRRPPRPLAGRRPGSRHRPAARPARRGALDRSRRRCSRAGRP